MKLCEHIIPIYQSEMKNGNRIEYLSRWGKNLIVYFHNKMNDYRYIPNITFGEERDCHFPFSQSYYCPCCNCALFGPLENNQKVWYTPARFTPYSEDAIVTPKSVEIPDALWENPNFFGVIPKVVGFDQK